MFAASSTATTGIATPRTSSAPPASSTIAANQADSVGSGTPMPAKAVAVPSSPHSVTFYQPRAMNTTPTPSRPMSAATSLSMCDFPFALTISHDEVI